MQSHALIFRIQIFNDDDAITILDNLESFFPAYRSDSDYNENFSEGNISA
jgi:RNA binding exosome subunit